VTVREHTVRTADGRALGVLSAGLESGPAVLVHSGSPGSRLLFRAWVEDAESRGLRLLGYDRPGYGRSTPQPGRAIADAAEDVRAIARALELDRLAVWGISGGGPHALACAALLGDLVVAAAALAAPAPFGAEGLDWFDGMGKDNVREFTVALEGREALEPLARKEAAEMVAAEPEALFDGLSSLLSPVDAAVLTGEFASFLSDSTREACREGIDGWLDDDLTFVRDWGFDVARIEVPVLLWQGDHDLFVPPAHGQWLAQRIPVVEAHLSPEDGHLTLALQRIGEVHAWLAERLA
jgi:pimeloyl-ACP methyl ester carboxylesterase